MGLLQKLLGAGAKATVGEIGKTIDALSTSAAERNEAKTAALASLLETQCRIVEAEARSGYWLAACWRPIVGLGIGACVLWSMVAKTFGYPAPEVGVEAWSFLMGYGGFRTGEKLLPLFMSRKERRDLKD